MKAGNDGGGLKPYMAYDGENGSDEGAVLVFAHDVKEAKKEAFPTLSDWGCEFLDMRVRLLEGYDHLFEEGDKAKLEAGISHIIDSPRSCGRCDMWGHPIHDDGVCDLCKEGDEDLELPAPEANT